METNSADQRCAFDNSNEHSPQPTENGGGGEDETDNDDQEEALSLCDFPQSRTQIDIDDGEESNPLGFAEAQEDFDFCSLSKDLEMCAADEIFFQGHILPLRRSIDSGTGLSLSIFNPTVSRSQSADYRCSGGLITSRSSSVSSRQSSSSGSSSGRLQKPPVNLFHSQPSPSPKLQGTRKIDSRNSANRSSTWNAIRLGLITAPPKMGFQDLKTRSNCKDRGRRHRPGNSSSSNKKKTRTNLLGGCDCLLSAVHTVPSEIVVVERSASAVQAPEVEGDNLLEEKSPKKRISHHRTFEWLKQLSLEEQRMNCTG